MADYQKIELELIAAFEAYGVGATQVSGDWYIAAAECRRGTREADVPGNAIVPIDDDGKTAVVSCPDETKEIVSLTALARRLADLF